MFASIKAFIMFPIRYHFWGSFALVFAVIVIMGAQVGDRYGFANSELYKDVEQRWGAPIQQFAPSARYVASGVVFNKLNPMTINQQHITIDSKMNYRKRGLVYFSGFDFAFNGKYRLANPESYDIDMVFVFPVSLERNKILLSNLNFVVDGKASPVSLSSGNDKLVWTGRLTPGQEVNFEVNFSGRGLNEFVYNLDPALPVKNFQLDLNITGGLNYDYPYGVVPASKITQDDEAGAIRLSWNYPSLESGVQFGVILPSEQSFDRTIISMLLRSWAPFLLFFLGLVVLSLYSQYEPKFFETYLAASCYGFFYVLLAYLTAFMNFYLAFFLTVLVIGLVLFYYLRSLYGKEFQRFILMLYVSFQVIPSLAVVLQGYTGLIYTLGILGALIYLMYLSQQTTFRKMFETNKPQEQVV